MPVTSRGTIPVLCLCAVLLLAFFFRSVPLTLDAVREINTPQQFDTTRALMRLDSVLDGTPHPVDSEALQQTRTRLLDQIRAMGYTPELRDHHHCVPIAQSGIRCARVQNIFFRAGPAQGPALLLTAHYDSVDVSPGFADDGIGLAVWLEIAHLLRQQPPAQPVVFLFTDGEEIGLVGARAFIDNRADYGFETGRVINLEARGVRGPALMFETSHPNAAVVHDWSNNGARLFANSMMAAIYELLPNNTDLTPHLEAGSQGINIAITDGVELYHSNRDDLAALDRRSVQHMGDQALGATRAFLAADWNEDAGSGELAYADVASKIFIPLPQTTAFMLLVLCLCASLLPLLKASSQHTWRKPDWRTLLLPPLAFVSAGLLALAMQQLVRLLRTEPVFWSAWPQAMNITIFAATLSAAVTTLALLRPRADTNTLFASAWFWLLLCGVSLSVAVPGFVMFFLIPGIALTIAGLAAYVFPRRRYLFHAAAIAVLTLHFFPIIHLIDVVMGLGIAAVYGMLEAMVLVPALASMHPLATARKAALLFAGTVLMLSTIITCLVPAYDEEHPLALNFMANYDFEQQNSVLFAAAPYGSLAELQDEFSVGAFATPPGFGANLPARELEWRQHPSATLTLLDEDSSTAGERTITLQITAPDARAVRLSIPAEASVLRYAHRGQVMQLSQAPRSSSVVEFVGQSADGAIIDITLGSPTRSDWLIQAMWRGLPEDAQALANRRPETTVRNRMGDITVTTRTQNL